MVEEGFEDLPPGGGIHSKKFSSRRLTTPYYLANLTLRLKTVRTHLHRCCSPMRTRRRLQTVDAKILVFLAILDHFWAHFWTISLSSESHVYTVHTHEFYDSFHLPSNPPISEQNKNKKNFRSRFLIITADDFCECPKYKNRDLCKIATQINFQTETTSYRKHLQCKR